MEKFYTRSDFSDATGIAIRTLENWAKKKLPPIALNRNETVCWYTPQFIIDAAREVLGTIDLDPASDSEANKTVKAIKFYSVVDSRRAEICTAV